MPARKYSWEDWFGRPRTTLVRGTHYQISQSAMVQSIRNAASARGVRTHLRDLGNAIVVEVVGGDGEVFGATPAAIAD